MKWPIQKTAKIVEWARIVYNIEKKRKEGAYHGLLFIVIHIVRQLSFEAVRLSRVFVRSVIQPVISLSHFAKGIDGWIFIHDTRRSQ